MRTIKLIILFSLIISVGPAYGEIKNDIAKAIVRVRSGSKYSTGFFWKNGTNIVTTLHSISKINDIEVYIHNSSKWYNANIIRIFKNGDLVLLKILDCKSDYFINQTYSSKPIIDTKVFTVGYNSGNANYQDRDFSVGLIQGNKIKDLLPSSAKLEIEKLGFPSLETEITYLKGQLLHGFSGSPIVDFEGKLVGIADGGLENGAAGISWCITVDSLNNLEQSKETFTDISQKAVDALFASEEVTSNKSITLKGFTFNKVKTRTFAQLDKTGNYSEMGLYQLLNAFQMGGIQYNEFTYDIYVEQKTGVTVAIPSGIELKGENGSFIASSDDGKNKIFIDISTAVNPQLSSLLFEENIKNSTGIFTWLPDYRLSFIQPLVRPDNVIINRKAFYHIQSHQSNKYLFEVLAGKETTFFGFYVLMDNAINSMNLMFTNPTESAKYNLAAQLSTFTY